MVSISRSRFGNLLRKHRRKAGWTQAELAERANLSVRGISDLERGVNRTPRRETAQELAEALALNPTDRAHFFAAGQRIPPLADPNCDGESSLLATSPGSPRLIGRQRERSHIERLLADDGTPMLLFYGEPGIGKTRLLQEAAEYARQAGWTVLTGGSHQLDGQHPYTPFVQALEGRLAGLSRAQRRMQVRGCEWMARLLPELMDVTLIPAHSWRLPPEQERRLMFAAVDRYLARIAEPVGVVLALDDLQWAAPDGLSLLAALLRSASASSRPYRLRVVAASRETRPSATRPLSPFVADLMRDSLVSVSRLGPLKMEQAGALMHAALDGVEGAPHDEREALIQRVVERAGGVPFFLMSYARAIRANPTASSQPLAATDIPGDIAEMIRHWVNGLPQEARDVLAVAAVYGREAPLSVLVAASGHTEQKVVEAVDAAIAARLLVEVDDVTCAFRHDLIREVVLSQLSATRARMLHRRVAEAMEADPRRARVEPLAFHYGCSSDAGKAILYLERAGDQAQAVHAYEAAAACYRGALARLTTSDTSGARGRLQEKIGALLMGCGKYDDAIGALEEAVTSYTRAGDGDGVGRAVAHIGWAYVRGGAADRGLSRVESLLAPDALARLTPPTQVALWRSHAVLLFALNRYVEQLESASRASALAREASDTEALAQSMRLEGLALVQLGRFDEALPVTLETVRLAKIAGDLDSFSAALNDTAAVYRVRGELTSSWTYSERSVKVAEQLGDPTGIAFLTSSHGDNAFLLGNWVEARQILERAVAVAREIGSSWVAAYPLLSLGQLYLAEGRGEDAVRALDEALACAERGQDLQALRCVQAILAERDLISGAAADALQRLQPLCASSQAEEKDSIALLPFVGWARLSLEDVTGAAVALTQCMQRAEATGNQLVIVDALLAQARLFIHQADWPQAEQALERALSCSRDMAYPYAEAKARFLYGRLHAATCALAQARAQYDQALRVCHCLGENLYRPHIERALAQLTRA